MLIFKNYREYFKKNCWSNELKYFFCYKTSKNAISINICCKKVLHCYFLCVAYYLWLLKQCPPKVLHVKLPCSFLLFLAFLCLQNNISGWHFWNFCCSWAFSSPKNQKIIFFAVGIHVIACAWDCTSMCFSESSCLCAFYQHNSNTNSNRNVIFWILYL